MGGHPYFVNYFANYFSVLSHLSQRYVHLETCTDTIYPIKFDTQEKTHSLVKAEKAYSLFLKKKKKNCYLYSYMHREGERLLIIIAGNYKWGMKLKIPVKCTKKRIDNTTMEPAFATLLTESHQLDCQHKKPL